MKSEIKKMKVVWICHFSNKQVREHLPLSKMKFNNFLRSLFGKKTTKYRDYASWVSNFIKEFEKFEDVELHVIAPHNGLIPFKYEFQISGIHYHFFRSEFFYFFSKLQNLIFRNRKRKYFLNRYYVRRFVKKIKPDIINLIGTENPYYSISVLDIYDVPIFVTVQTVYTNPLRKIYSDSYSKSIWDLELKIHNKEKYFGCDGRIYRDLILNNNSKAIIFKIFFPVQRPTGVIDVPKEYDFVFFAAIVTVKKGIEDAIEALFIAKNEKENISLNVVGACDEEYKAYLMEKIAQKGLEDNISFNSYFPIHTDMHQHIKKSKFALLPVKLDVIPGTIKEAALLEIPIVAYKTTGTPYINKNGEAILISDIGDVQGLADNMIKLMKSQELAEKLKKNAKKFIEQEFDNTKNGRVLVNVYQAVYNHFHNNIPIPEELLFNTNEFPLY